MIDWRLSRGRKTWTCQICKLINYVFYLSQSEFAFLSIAIKRAPHNHLDRGCGGDIQKCPEGIARISPIVERPGKL